MQQEISSYTLFSQLFFWRKWGKVRQFCQYGWLPGRDFKPVLLKLEAGILTTFPRRPVVLNTSKILVFKFQILTDKVELKVYYNFARHS